VAALRPMTASSDIADLGQGGAPAGGGERAHLPPDRGGLPLRPAAGGGGRRLARRSLRGAWRCGG
jgi:hypothetical protein